MKTQGDEVDCMARSGLYHSRPASITSYTNELNTNRPKQTDIVLLLLVVILYVDLYFVLECKNNGICVENTINWSGLSQWKYVRLPTVDADMSECKYYLHL